MLPLSGTNPLIRVYRTDLKTGVCSDCKTRYDIEIMTNGDYEEIPQTGLNCPSCHGPLKGAKRWYYRCPVCEASY